MHFDRDLNDISNVHTILDPEEDGYNIFDNLPIDLLKTDTSGTELNECDKIDCDDNEPDIFEIEESEAPLIPLYKLKDEENEKWVLLSDLCYVLKVKSKDTLLKQVSRRQISILDDMTKKKD